MYMFNKQWHQLYMLTCMLSLDSLFMIMVFHFSSKRVISYPKLGKEPPRGSFSKGSPWGGSFDRNPLGRPPPDPHVGLYGWSTPDPRIFMPPWYQPNIVQFEPSSKLPYWNFNIQDTWRILIMMLKSEFSRRQSKLMARLWRLISSTCLVSLLWNNISKWGQNFVQDHPNCTFEELELTFCKCFQTMKNDEEVYMWLRNL